MTTHRRFKRIIAATAIFASATVAVAAQTPADATADSLNRAVASVMAASLDPILNNLSNAGLPIDRGEVGRYITEALKGADIGFTSEAGNAFVDAFLRKGTVLSPESQQAFIDSLAALDGSVVTPSGLVFRVIVEGEGVSPSIKDKVHVRYVGRFSDGTVFDDTGNETITFDLGQEIPGFTEGLQMMKPGGTYRIVVPANLAYGEEGIPGIIPGNAALDFTVTLDSITPNAAVE